MVSVPVVGNVAVIPREDGSNLVDIHYDLSSADGDPCTVWVAVSDDGGTSWRVPARTFTGDVGEGITPGRNRTVIWDAGADGPGAVGGLTACVYAEEDHGPAPMVMVQAGPFPYQNATDPEQWVFVESFLIDKYEVTNRFYCQFLNDVDSDGDHWDDKMEIDRCGEPGSYSYTVQPGKEGYPIRYVNLYDAKAFAAWRSGVEGATHRLPTEQEWEKAAAWDPVRRHHYRYGFQQDTIDSTWCNYNYNVGRPTEVGHYDGTGGTRNAVSYYGCYDMSGNVLEWCATPYGVLRGGAWARFGNPGHYCRCTTRHGPAPRTRNNWYGFRLARNLD